MLENVQKGLCMPLFEYSGRVSIIKTQPEKLITEITNFNNFKSCIFNIFGHFLCYVKIKTQELSFFVHDISFQTRTSFFHNIDLFSFIPVSL